MVLHERDEPSDQDQDEYVDEDNGQDFRQKVCCCICKEPVPVFVGVPMKDVFVVLLYHEPK